MRIDMLEVYKDRLKEIDNQIKNMARTKNFNGYGAIKSEKAKLKGLIEKLEGKRLNAK